jgi:hypothetical protein
MHYHRSTPWLVLSTIVVAGSALVTAPASAGNVTTTSILAAANAAMAKQTGVHLVIEEKAGKTTTLEVADLAKEIGVESVSSGSEKATVKVAVTYGYMGGNSTGLTSLMGLTAAQAKKLGTKWMSLKAGTSPYSSLKSSATIPALTSLLPAVKGTASSTEQSGGVQVYVLKWTTTATSSAPKLSNVLTVSEGATILPITEVTSDSSASETTTFSKWGESVVVNPPAASQTVPYATITG